MCLKILAGIPLVAAAYLPTAPAVAQDPITPPTIHELPSDGPRMSKRQQEILDIVRNADGYITEELHSEFWSSMPFKGQQLVDLKRMLVDMVEKVIGPSQTLGYETWRSAQMSLRAGRVVRSERLNPAIRAVVTAVDNPSYRTKVQSSIKEVDEILTAAADGTPLKTDYGPMFINEDTIAQTLAGIEGGIRRSEMLFNPTWGPELRYYKHPDLHIALLTEWPFKPSKSTVTLSGGVVSDHYNLEKTVSESQWATIGFGDYSQAIRTSRIDISDPAALVLKNAQSGLAAVGAKPASNPRAELWRGYHSAEASGQATDGVNIVYVALRSVYLPQHKGGLVFTTVSLNSLGDAQQMMDQLEFQTQILR